MYTVRVRALSKVYFKTIDRAEREIHIKKLKGFVFIMRFGA